MAEYYAVLSKAVGSLEVSTPEARRAVYDKARNALIGQLKAIVPPLPTSEISRQRLELEEAIRRAEREASAAGSGSGRPVSRPAPAPPPAAAAPPPPPPAREIEEADTDDGRPSPQDVFRRAIQEAESRGASAPPIERAPPPPPPRRDYDDDRVEVRRERGDRDRAPPPRDEPVPYVPAADARGDRRPAPAPRLAPDYDWEPSPQVPPPPPQSRFPVAGDPYIDGRDRPAKIRDGRRRGNDEDRDTDIDVEEVRPSRLPTILLLGVIIAMVGGLAALAWSQREMLKELFAFDGGGTSETIASQPAVAPASPAAPASSKDADRLPGSGPAPADAVQPGVRVVAPNGATAAAPPATQAGVPSAAGALVGQKATLYEEPLDSAAAAKGVTAINGAVTWSYVADSADGPQVVAQLDVPQRKLKIKLVIRRNADKALPASHIVDIIATVPPDFPGKGIKSVPRLVMKPAEEQRGQPLVGYPAQYAVGIFGIGLSSVEADLRNNLTLMRERGWIDLPLVYDTGQRAILTFERGNQGDRVFQQALAAWGG